MTDFRRFLCLAALLIAGGAGAEVPQVVRDSVHDWRCVDAEYNLISNHQRQDRAIVVCQEQAEAHPGETFYIEGGRYRVVVEATDPPIQQDADGDGVPDADDSCPSEVGPAPNDGCPVVQPPADLDGDGIPDADDQCPSEFGPASNHGCPVVQPPPSGAAPYDLTLGGTRSFPSAELTGGQAVWPTEPSTNQTIDVVPGNFTSLQNAVNTSGALVNVPAGTYTGNLYVNASDVDIRLDDGAVLTGTLEFGDYLGGDLRVRWTGGQHTGRGSNGGGPNRIYIRGNDVLINNLRSFGTDGVLVEGARRLAIINSSIASEYYALFSQQFSDNRDYIFANNLFTTTSPNQATVRLMSVARLVYVDNRSVSGAGNRALRVHYATQDAWIAGNEFVARTAGSHMWITESGGGPNSYGPFGRIYIFDNAIYSDQGFYADTDIGPEAAGGDIHVLNTTSYNNNYSSNPDFVNEVSTSGMTWSGNVRLPYQAPPAFAGGADH